MRFIKTELVLVLIQSIFLNFVILSFGAQSTFAENPCIELAVLKNNRKTFQSIGSDSRSLIKNCLPDGELNSLCKLSRSYYRELKPHLEKRKEKFQKLEFSEVLIDKSPNLFNSIQMRGNTGYLTFDGSLLISKDRGRSWNKAQITTSKNVKIHKVFVDGYNIYLLTPKQGILVSNDDGRTWKSITKKEGLASNLVFSVFAMGSRIYVATDEGLSISEDSGKNWHTVIVDRHSETENVYQVYAVGNKVYAATDNGLFISKDGGKTWESTKICGPFVNDIFADGEKVYVATRNGLWVSPNGGTDWQLKTVEDGLKSTLVNTVFAKGEKVITGHEIGVSISIDKAQTWIKKEINSKRIEGRKVSPLSKVLGVFYQEGELFAAHAGGFSISYEPVELKRRAKMEDQ